MSSTTESNTQDDDLEKNKRVTVTTILDPKEEDAVPTGTTTNVTTAERYHRDHDNTPRHTRTYGRSRLMSDDLFSEQRSEDDDGIMNITLGTSINSNVALPRRQYTKLEVVQAYQIRNLLNWHHLFVVIGALYTIIVVILMNWTFAERWKTDMIFGWGFDLRRYKLPLKLNWFNQAVSIPMFLYTLCLFLLFTTRIFRLKVRSRTKEQIWIIFLLFFMMVYMNPFQQIVKMHDVLVHLNEPLKQWRSRPWCGIALKASEALKVAGFTGSTIFYIWASIHSYRMLETKITYMFYIPKFLILAVYVTSKIVMHVEYDIVSAELIFATFIGMLSTYSTADFWYRPGVLYASISFAFEVLLTIYIVMEYRSTREVLKNSDYLKYRTQQIGFRLFVYHNITFYFVFTFLYITLLTAIPNAANVFLVRHAIRKSVFRLHDLQFGIDLLLLAYVTVEAYVNLPADSSGFFSWLDPRSSSTSRIELEPITYCKREPPSLHGVVPDLRVNCFVMQTHVTLFNFAWLVYYWNTPKVEDFQLTEDVFKFGIADYIADKETDTHVLIIDGADRIVIAFKGTTSSKNLKTDINMFYSPANQLLPTCLGEGDDKQVADNPILSTRHWRRAKVHKGFAVAYAAVAPRLITVLMDMQKQRRRPVYLTGHSLGGALATVCSLDLHLCMGLTHKDIFVSTFGAPRVGNFHFALVYNDSVPIHWRIVVGPDVVAKLPKMGYRHVGKKALITVDGDLFIDPNSLELNIWSGDVASILYHRKASYLLAMRAWCERHHGDEYVPEFWPFPVSKDDTKRFQHAMVKSSYSLGIMSSATPNRDRIRELDAMVEALNTGPEPKREVAMKWLHLARKALEAEGLNDRQVTRNVDPIRLITMDTEMSIDVDL